MGDAVMRNSMLRTSRPGLAVVVTTAMLAWGCASAKPKATAPANPVAAAPAAATPAVAAAPTTVEIEKLQVFEAVPGAQVQLESDAPLVWTSYRDTDGNLVIDLPNSRPGAGVVNRLYAQGLVASVKVSNAGVPSRPLTRLVIATRGETEHRLDARGKGLMVELVPSGQAFPAGNATAVAAAAQPERPPNAASTPSASPAAVATQTVEPSPVAEQEAAAEPEPASATAPAPVEAAAPVASNEPIAVAQEPLEPIDSSQLAYGTPDNPVVAPPPTGEPASKLEGVKKAGEAAVRILGNGEFSYSTFRLENPERFVIDLAGVVNHSDRGSLSVAEGPVMRVRISQFKVHPSPIARVVFDLTSPSVPAIQRTASGLVVRFGEGATAAPAQAAAQAAPPTSKVAPPSVATPPAAPVDEQVAAAAPQPAAPAETVESAPPAVAFAAPSASAPPPAPTAAPTSDVAAFPAAETTASAPEKVSDFEAQDVQPMAPPERGVPRLTPAVVAGQTVMGGKKEYTGEPISMSLKDADVKEVLRTFARLSGLNIVIQPGVRGTVTVELEKVPWDQALDQILKINGLGYELDGNIMRVAPLSVLEQEAKRAQALAQAQALSVPLRTVVKRLSYSQAGEIAGLLRRGGGIMSRRGTVIVDARTNTLIIKELPNYIDTVLAVIETLDTPEPQVMIESRIVETTKQFSRTLGISWGFNGVADQAHGNTTGLEFPNHGTASGGVGLLTGGANGFIDLSLGNILDTFTLNARLQAAESEGLVNILSAPKVATMNNHAASIQSGVQLPIQTTANNTTSVQFVNATLQLRVTPHVTAEGTVMLDISVQKREPLFALQVAGAPSAPISTKEARTRVIVRDGGTTVIGGIYKVTTDQGQDRVPGLANIPLLGHLFKNRRTNTSNDELLIFISPRVIKL